MFKVIRETKRAGGHLVVSVIRQILTGVLSPRKIMSAKTITIRGQQLQILKPFAEKGEVNMKKLC